MKFRMCLFVMILSIMVFGSSPAFATGIITGFYPTIDTAGFVAGYDIHYTQSGLSINTGSSIVIKFSDNMVVPESIDANYIRINDTVALSVYTDVINKTITIASRKQINSNLHIEISSLAGIANPISGSATVTLTVPSGSPISKSFAVTTSVGNLVCIPSDVAAGTLTSYKVSFKTVNPLAQNEKINITFPPGTTLGAAGSFQVKVNNITATGITVDSLNRNISISVPQSILADATVDVELSGGITNPRTQGEYNISVSTTKDTGIVSTPVTVNYLFSDLRLTPSTVVPNTPVKFDIRFSVHSAGTILTTDRITLKFGNLTMPTSLPANRILVNGEYINNGSGSIGVINNSITFSPPRNISGALSVVIRIDADNIINPVSGHVETTLEVSKDARALTVSYPVASTGVTSGNVELSNSIAGAVTQYTINFNTSNKLVIGEHIYLDFPSNTYMGNITPSLVTVNGKNATEVKLIEQRKISIKIPETINPGSVAVVIKIDAGMENPTVVGAYRVGISTTTDATRVETAPYQITSGNLTSPTVTVSPRDSNTAADYTINFSLGGNGRISANATWLYVYFPAGSTVPMAISTSTVRVNEINVTAVERVDEHTIRMKTAQTLVGGDNVTVNISRQAEIKNPPVDTDTEVTLGVRTDRESTFTNSLGYVIYAARTNIPVVIVNPPTSGANAEYIINFMAGDSALNKDSLLELSFPAGTSLPLERPFKLNPDYRETIEINGYKSADIFIPGSRFVTVQLPRSIAPNSTVEIRILNTFGLKNPSFTTNTLLSLEVKLPSPAAEWISSSFYKILGTNPQSSVTNVTATLSTNRGGTAPKYNVRFKTGLNGALLADTDTVSIQFPAGTVVPNIISAGDVKINGKSPLYVIGNNKTREVIMVVSNNIGHQTLVDVEINQGAGILLPTTPDTYNLQVKTSADSNYVISNNFEVIIDANTSSPSVSVAPRISGAEAEYVIRFNTGPNGNLKAGDSIDLEFPAGTILPSGLSANLIEIMGYRATSVSSPGSRLLTIRTPIDISAGETVNITIFKAFGIKNPSSSSDTYYDLRIRTSKQPAWTTSSSYRILGTNSTFMVSGTRVWLSKNRAGDVPNYTIRFTTSPNGALTPDDQINIVFPVDTVVPQYIFASDIRINGKTPKSVATNIYYNRSLSLSMPSNEHIGAGYDVVIEINSQAGINLPTNPGEHRLRINTSTDSNYADSDPFKVVIGVSSASVTLSSAQVGKVSGYTITFKTGPKGALKGGENYITIVFPEGTKVPGNISYSNIIVNNNALNPGDVMISGRSISLKVPLGLDIRANSLVTVRITSGAKIVNPPGAGTYRLKTSTSIEDTLIDSEGYLILSSAIPQSSGKSTIRLQIGSRTATKNGVPFLLDSAPMLLKGTTLVPLRFVGEALNCLVNYDAKTRKITISAPGKTIVMTVYSKSGSLVVDKAFVNGKEYRFEVPSVSSGGRIQVPLRFISEHLGARVTFNSADKSIVISK